MWLFALCMVFVYFSYFGIRVDIIHQAFKLKLASTLYFFSAIFLLLFFLKIGKRLCFYSFLFNFVLFRYPSMYFLLMLCFRKLISGKCWYLERKCWILRDTILSWTWKYNNLQEIWQASQEIILPTLVIRCFTEYIDKPVIQHPSFFVYRFLVVLIWKLTEREKRLNHL